MTTSPTSAISAIEKAIESLSRDRAHSRDRRDLLVIQAKDGIAMISAIAPYDPADIREFILEKRRQAT